MIMGQFENDRFWPRLCENAESSILLSNVLYLLHCNRNGGEEINEAFC